MIRDATLKTKRHELENVVTRRKRKLQELYHATVFLTNPEYALYSQAAHRAGLPPHAEDEFLDANNISEGKFFDVATLSRIAGFGSKSLPFTKSHYGHQNRESVSNRDGETRPQKSEVSDEPAGIKRVSDPDRNSQHDQSNKTVSPGWASRGIQTGGTSVDSGPQSTEGISVEPQIQGQAARYPGNQPDKVPNFILPPIDSVRGSGIHQSTARLRTGNEDNFNIPSDRVVISRGNHESTPYIKPLDSDQDAHLQNAAQATIVNVSKPISQSAVQDKVSPRLAVNPLGSNIVSPNPEESTRTLFQVSAYSTHEPEIKKKNSDNPLQESSMLSHPAASESDLPGGAPSTPDAQLRFEETQFMNPSLRHDDSRSADPSNKALSLEKTSLGDVYTLEGSPRLVGKVRGDGSSNGDACSLPMERKILPSQNRRIPGMTRDLSKDLMFSARVPMRIDTGVSSPKGPVGVPSYSSSHALANTDSPATIPAPGQAISPPVHSSQPERMTTRVSSGSMRQKSVSEILGETQKTPVERKSSEGGSGTPTPKFGPLVKSPDSAGFRSRLSELKERESQRSKLSTVVFARQQLDGGHEGESTSRQLGLDPKNLDEHKDYLTPLFTAQAIAQQPSLNTLIGTAHKTLTTSNYMLDFREQQDCRMLKRIYHLQNSNRWSLRQLERSTEPARPVTHWDTLLNHMKWMRTDFREERKWKIAAANNLADWCAEWVASSPEQRMTLQLKRLRSASKTRGSDKHATPASLPNVGESLHSEPTPDLVPSMDDDFSDVMDYDSPHLDISRSVAPAAIFSLAPEEILFSLDNTPASEKLLSELPLYRPVNAPEELTLNSGVHPVDNGWKMALTQISKFATGKMILQESGPVRKKSRYEYAVDESGEGDPTARLLLASNQTQDPIPPEKKDVALFSPENKHIIDRLYTAHAFRPPSEFNMPFQSFFESRQASQWTWREDGELRRLVREYQYNWSLIASCLSPPSKFPSTAERRTPWECFERWVLLEGLPQDMARTQYFRTWHSRRHAARKSIGSQCGTQPPLTNGSTQTQPHRRNSEPITVERRRNTKHLSLVHAMQKVAKKKETQAQKQAHVASMAAMRKSTENPQQRQRMSTPQEFSKFRHDRELRLQGRNEVLLRQSALAHQRAAMLQKANVQVGAPNMSQPGRGTVASGTASSASPLLGASIPSNSLPSGHASQSRPSLPPQPMNGTLSNNQPQPHALGTNVPTASVRGVGIPQASMQGLVPGQPRLPSAQMSADSMRVFLEASRVQEQQQFLAQQRQQRYQPPNGQSGLSSSSHPANLNLSAQSNAALLSSLQVANGKLSPATNGVIRPSVSPQLASVQAQQLSSGHTPMVNSVSSSLKLQFPGASPEQIKHMATHRMNEALRNPPVAHGDTLQALGPLPSSASANASNLAALAGNLNLPPLPPQQQPVQSSYNSVISNSQMYAQYMHSQQASQAQNRSGSGSLNGINVGLNVNGQRPSSRGMQGVGATDQSPRPPQAQIAGVP